MSVPVRDFLQQRRNRALGTIMGHLEREHFANHAQPDRDRCCRMVVLEAINGYHDAVLDLLKAEDNNSVRNEEVIALLQRLDKATSDPRTRRMTTPA